MGHYKAYLKAEGISGGSTDAGHAGEIDLQSYSIGQQQSSGVGGSHGSGKVTITDVHITKLLDATSSIFFTKCANGEKISKATISVAKAQSDKNVAIMKYDLEEVFINSINILPVRDGSNDPPLESISLDFGKISFQYFQPKE